MQEDRRQEWEHRWKEQGRHKLHEHCKMELVAHKEEHYNQAQGHQEHCQWELGRHWLPEHYKLEHYKLELQARHTLEPLDHHSLDILIYIEHLRSLSR